MTVWTESERGREKERDGLEQEIKRIGLKCKTLRTLGYAVNEVTTALSSGFDIQLGCVALNLSSDLSSSMLSSDIVHL